MLPDVRYSILNIILVLMLSTCTFHYVFSASITDLRLGSQSGYSLLVIGCDHKIPYEIQQKGASVLIIFPAETRIQVSDDSLRSLHDSIIQSVSFLADSAAVRILLKSNYDIKVYSQKFPFRLVLDFTAKPGIPPSEIITAPPLEAALPAPETEPEPVAEIVTKEAVDTSALPPPKTLTSEDSLNILLKFVNYWDEGEELPMAPLPENEAFLRGLNLKRAGEYEAALTEFLKSAPFVPGQGHYQAALIYKILKQPRKAIKELGLAISEMPNSIPPRIELGFIYQSLGKTGKAEKIWREIFTVIPADSIFDFSRVASQVELLQSLLNSDDLKQLPPPLPKRGNLPIFPWVWMMIMLSILSALVLGKAFANWRMRRLYKTVVRDEAAIPLQPGKPLPFDPQKNIKKAIEEEEEEEETDIMSELAALGISTEGLSDEKQQRIYDLAKQNYSIAEIARMLNMGQEEVKFILDFRTKTEDGAVGSEKKK